MRRNPGVVFGDSPSGRTAYLAGTGIAVFEVVRAYREMGEDWDDLKQAYHWLSELQLRSALAYAEAYPEEIAQRLAAEERWTADSVWRQYPFTDPMRR